MKAKLTAKLETLYRDGSPIASPDTYGEMAAVAIRRWNSFDRRTKIRNPTREDRIQDLAKGLCAAFESDLSLVGPLHVDYRHTATALGDVLAEGG
jgi:hypothetical protein